MPKNNEVVCVDCNELVDFPDTCSMCEQDVCQSCFDLHEESCSDFMNVEEDFDEFLSEEGEDELDFEEFEDSVINDKHQVD